MKNSLRIIVEGLFSSISDVLSYLYTESRLKTSIMPHIFLLSIVSFAVLSSFVNEFSMAFLLLANLVVLVLILRVNVVKLLRIIVLSSLLTGLFLLPFSLYLLLTLPRTEFITRVLDETNGLLIVLIRSMISVGYLSLIPLTLGVSGLIYALMRLGISHTHAMTLLLTYRKIPAFIDELTKMFMGRASRKVSREKGIPSLWNSLADSVGETILRGVSLGLRVELGFRSRILANYNIKADGSLLVTLAYIIYALLVISIVLFWQVGLLWAK